MSVDSVMIEAQEIGKSFSNVRAVDRISFSVHRGEIFALLGPNGAGKTTLVRMLVGILPPDQGAFSWFDARGRQVARNSAALSYLPEDRGLYKDQKVQRTLEYFGALRGLNRHQARRAAIHWLNRLDLMPYASAKLETLSKGNQQKVQIASSMLHQPGLAVLDEPFSGLDPINQELMIDVIRGLQASGTTVLLSAHQLNLVERLADRVLLIAKGREVLSGTMDDVRGGAYGGNTLQVQFAAPVATDQLAAIRSLPGICELHLPHESTLVVRLLPEEDPTTWLSELGRFGKLTTFHCDRTPLHEIYLRAVGQSSGTNAMELTS